MRLCNAIELRIAYLDTRQFRRFIRGETHFAQRTLLQAFTLAFGRSDTGEWRPTWRIARRKAFFQTFINFVARRISVEHPMTRPGDGSFWPGRLNAARHHVIGRAAAAIEPSM